MGAINFNLILILKTISAWQVTGRMTLASHTPSTNPRRSRWSSTKPNPCQPHQLLVIRAFLNTSMHQSAACGYRRTSSKQSTYKRQHAVPAMHTDVHAHHIMIAKQIKPTGGGGGIFVWAKISAGKNLTPPTLCSWWTIDCVKLWQAQILNNTNLSEPRLAHTDERSCQ